MDLWAEDRRRVIETDPTGAFVVGREAARCMTPRGRGEVAIIGSLTGEPARAVVAPYTVAKGDIKMLTRATAWPRSGPGTASGPTPSARATGRPA